MLGKSQAEIYRVKNNEVKPITMRRELEELAILDQYIDGQLSESEQTDFEKRIKNEPSLKQALDDQITLRKGVDRIVLKKEISSAKGNGGFGKKRFGLIFIAILIATLSVYFATEKEEISEKKVVKEEQLLPVIESELNDTIVQFENNPSEDIFLEDTTKVVEQVSIKEEVIEELGFDVETQVFVINNAEFSRITGKDGVVISFTANSFEGGDSIEIRLKEYYNYADILMRGLSTTSNGQLIETGGMIHLEAFSKGEKVNLKTGKDYEIAFPKRAGIDLDAKTFYAESEKDLNWEVDTNGLLKQHCRMIRSGRNLVEFASLPGMQALQKFKPVQQYMLRFGFNTKEALLFSNSAEFPTGRVTVKIVKGKITEVKVDTKDKNFKMVLLAYLKKLDKEAIKKRALTYDVEIWYENPDNCRSNQVVFKGDFSSEEIEVAGKLNQTLYVSEYNIIKSLKLGLVNCDAFTNIQEELINLKYLTSVDCKVMLMFKNRDIFLSNYGFSYKERSFNRIPVDTEVILVAFRQSEDDDLEVCIQDFTTNGKEESIPLVHFAKMTTKQFTREINVLKEK